MREPSDSYRISAPDVWPHGRAFASVMCNAVNANGAVVFEEATVVDAAAEAALCVCARMIWLCAFIRAIFYVSLPRAFSSSSPPLFFGHPPCPASSADGQPPLGSPAAWSRQHSRRSGPVGAPTHHTDANTSLKAIEFPTPMLVRIRLRDGALACSHLTLLFLCLLARTLPGVVVARRRHQSMDVI